ncbi:hypothetical protein evm_011588 [Chilo suppressalis]|nr:hypothetical protein evm_011588 [Chilo suppressalis]
MKISLTVFFCLVVVMTVFGKPVDDIKEGEKHEAMETVNDAANDAGKALSDAGESVVDAVTPTEKSVIDKMTDGVKGIGQ